MTRSAARRALLLAALVAISSAADQHTRAAKGRQREEAEPPPAKDWEPPPPVFMLFAFSGGSEDVVYEALRSAFTGCTLMPHASFVILTDTKETHNTVSTGLLRACPNHVASCGVRTSAQVGEACAWLSPRSAVCSTGRSSVTLTCAPPNIASRLPARSISLASASNAATASEVRCVFDQSKWMPATSSDSLPSRSASSAPSRRGTSPPR